VAVLVLNRKGLAKRPVHEWLHDVPDRLLLVAPRSPAALRDLDRHFAEVVEVDDFDSWSVDVAAADLCRRHGARLVASLGEREVVRSARLREHLGIPGQSLACALAYRDKVRMKTAVAAAGVPVPAFEAVDRPQHLVAFAERHGYPIVVKPRTEAGSLGIHYVHDEQALRSMLASGLLPAAPDRSGHLMVEAFVDAPLHHVDGMMHDGRVLHCWPSVYSCGNAEAVQELLPIAGRQLGMDDPYGTTLVDLATRVIAALPPSTMPTAFHLEAWMRTAGEPVFCEIASRPGGGGIIPSYERSFGVHLARENLRGQAGLPLFARPSAWEPHPYTGWVVFTPKEGMFVPPSGPCPVPGVTLELQMTSGSTHDGPRQVGDAAGLAVVEGAHPDDIAERVDDVVSWWEREARWT
jgi:biotin carboxylase